MVTAAKNLYVEMASRLPAEAKATDRIGVSADIIMSSGKMTGAQPYQTLAERLEDLARRLTP
jgi:hypothetical protein